MALYVQKIALVPDDPHGLWVGWDIEGVSGEVPGLIPVDALSEQQLQALGVSRFSRVPASSMIGPHEQE